MTQDVGVRFSGSATGAVGAARETAAAIGTVRAEASGLSPALQTAERDTGRLSRGLLAGTGALSGFGRSLAFASGTFLGGAGLIAGLKGAYEQAETSVKALDSLGVVIRRNNGDVAAATPLILKWAAGQKQFGVSIADSQQGLARAAAITGSVQQAMVAYDEALVISKATGKDFNAVLIAASKAQDGQTSALARYIGTVPKGTTAQQLYNDVMAKYRGQAAANTSVTDKLRASLANMELKIGQDLLPVVQQYAGELDTWLSKSQNQKRVTDDVTTAVRLLGGVLGTARDILQLVDKATGGLKNTMELLIGLKVAGVLNGWTGALKGFVGWEAAGGGAGLVGARGAASKLVGVLEKLAAMKVIQIAVVLEVVKKLTGSGWDLSQGTASDSTITVDGKSYPIGTSAAWEALVKAGWKPPKGVTAGTVTAQQEIGAAKSLGGSGQVAKAGDGTRPSTSAARGIVGTAKWAAAQPGASTSYQWGGIPGIGKGSHTDCSGFAQAVYRQNGISIPRTSQAQYASAKTHPKRDQLQPGDLVFFDYEGPHSHVGIYVGGGMMIGDQHTGSGIVTVGMDWTHYDGAASYSAMPRGTGGGGGGVYGTPPPSSVSHVPVAPQVPARIQLAISKANQAAAAAALTPGKADDRKAVAEQKAALDEEIAYLKRKLQTNVGTKQRITLEDLLTGAEQSLANLAPGGTKKAAGASAGVLEGLRNTISGDLGSLPAQLTPGEQVAVDHLKALKKRLVPGLDPKDLADVRAGVSRWGKTLKDAIRAAATTAGQAWNQSWQGMASKALRDFQEQVVQPQLDAFDKQTAAGLKQIQDQYAAATPEEQALAAFQAQRSAASKAKQKGDLQQQIADTQTQLQGLSSSGTLIDIATGQRTVLSGSDIVAQTQQLQKQLSDLQDQYAQLELDDQETALQTAADQSRTAADDKSTQAQQAYQDERDAQRQHLSDMLADQTTAFQTDLANWGQWIEAKKKSWTDFLKWLAQYGVIDPTLVPSDLSSPPASSPPGSGGVFVPRPPHGFAAGGKVPGPRLVQRDSVPALLMPGETVIDRTLTDALEQMAASGGLGGGSTVAIFQLDKREFARAIAQPVTDAQARQIGYTMQRN